MARHNDESGTEMERKGRLEFRSQPEYSQCMRVTDAFDAQRRITRAFEEPMQRHLETQRKMRRAMEGPLERYLAQQAQVQEVIEGPMQRYLETQEKMRKLAEGPLKSYLDQQAKLQAITEGPMQRYLETQEKMQRAMEGPLASYLAGQARLQDAVAPLLANEDRLRKLAETLAAVEPTSDSASLSPLAVWLGIAARLPSVTRLRLASELIGIALAVASFAEVSANADVDHSTEWVQAAVALLFGLAGYLLRFVDDES